MAELLEKIVTCPGRGWKGWRWKLLMLCSPRSSRTGTPSSQTSNLWEWELECSTFFDLLKVWNSKYIVLGEVDFGTIHLDRTSKSKQKVDGSEYWMVFMVILGQTLSVLKEKYRKGMTNHSKRNSKSSQSENDLDRCLQWSLLPRWAWQPGRPENLASLWLIFTLKNMLALIQPWKCWRRN